MKPPTLHGPAADFALAALFLHPTDVRLETVRRAAERVELWDGVVPALERHGVAVLAHRNAELAGVEPPPSAREAWEERAAALREDALRFRLTLLRLVDALAAVGIEPTLLKGASLALDLYPEPALRGQGDLDVLVEPGEVRAAVRAGEAAGLLPPEQSLPTWWYRWAHFHLKLAPSSPLLREVELHWALHHPSLLLTPDPAALQSRREARELAGRRVWSLDPLDRLLHLVTHLVSHAHGLPGEPDRAALRAVVEHPDHPLRLKWVLDVHAEVERVHAELPAERLAERAREWSAEGQLAWCLRWVRGALGLAGSAEGWADEFLGLLAPPDRARRLRATGAGPLPGLDFRAGSLTRLGRWIWPPSAYLERRYRGRGPLGARRWSHAARALARAALGGGALPLAMLGSAALRRGRRRKLRRAQAPERVLDLAAAWRSVQSEPAPSSPTRRSSSS